MHFVLFHCDAKKKKKKKASDPNGTDDAREHTFFEKSWQIPSVRNQSRAQSREFGNGILREFHKWLSTDKVRHELSETLLLIVIP